MYEQILVALDGSELAERVLPHVEALAGKFGSRVTLLQATTSAEQIIAQSTAAGDAVGPAVVDPAPIVEAEQREATTYLTGVANRLRSYGLTVEAEEPEGPAAEMILERAAALGVDLIAMTTLGRGGLGRLVFGSVADRVLRHATCPILLVRIAEDESTR